MRKQCAWTKYLVPKSHKRISWMKIFLRLESLLSPKNILHQNWCREYVELFWTQAWSCKPAKFVFFHRRSRRLPTKKSQHCIQNDTWASLYRFLIQYKITEVDSQSCKTSAITEKTWWLRLLDAWHVL